MLSPLPKRPCSRLSLRARRDSLARGCIQATAPAPGCTAPKAQVALRSAEGNSGGIPCKLSRRHRRAAPAQGERAAPGDGAAPAQGEGAAPGDGAAPAQGEGAAPAQGEGAAPANGAAQGEGAAPANGAAQGEGAAPGNGAALGEGAALAQGDGLILEEGRPPLPYYLRNFLLVMETVLESEDKELFNEADDHWLGTFQKLSESDLCNVSEALNLLSAPELKLLARNFHLRPQGQRAEILGSLLRLSKQQSIFSCSQKPSSPGLALLNRVKKMIGNCVRVATPARAVFSRLLLLFNLTDYTDEEEAASAGQNQLSTVLLVNMGHVTFPNYTVLRKKKIFRHRDDLLRYDEAVHSLAEVITAMTNGFWSDALQIYKTAREKWSQLENNSDVRFHQQLPVYLRRFTAGWVYTRIQFHGVEILQRLHMYAEAVEELQNLLEQSIYCPGSHGHWWNRLSLNLHQHLKQTDQAIHCLRKGLDDVSVHLGHRLALYQRALRIRDSPSCKKWCHLLQDLPVVSVEDVPHVTIKARSCPGMGNALFLMENISEGSSLGQGEPCSTVICSVEEVSLAYYQQQGFDQGIHGEGTTFLTLFGLLFWDIIFLSGIPDVFRNPYQACPLDLYTDCFYEQRRECIESRVDFLENASIDTLCTLIADAWNGYRGINATLVNWEIFNSLQQVQSLVSCLGGPFLSGICRILAKDLRHGRGGLPDLVVWNSHRCQYKLAEVKGPSDQLSHKQMVWLDQLQRLGADVEVCHVNAVGARSHQLS
ncbi:fanconi-associated nuclease 1 isoform X2 [Rhincodon typus]|uniref:fanconi-associated nuclease 1 isoform X2 n=1 Tax=Rhincodon typus TaxID=259920 RepID=UPI00202FB677|nr:fanconi-associated nuclease 1 isoform X2 [Rhincodon typus]